MDSGIPQMTAVGGSAANLGADIAKMAPLATAWGGPSVGVPTQQVIKSSYSPQSNLDKFGSFLGNLGSETGHIVGGAAHWLGQQVTSMATSIPRDIAGVSHIFTDNNSVNQINAQTQQLSQRLNTLSGQYRDGAINRTQYQSAMKDLVDSANKLTELNKAVDTRINTDKANATKAWIDTASAALTVMTVGADSIGVAAAKLADSGLPGITETGLKSLANWTASEAAKPLLEPMSGLISKISTDSTAFKALDTITQGALQKATAEVITKSAADMTAGQLARATAMNIAIKYPITYNYLSTTANQIYTELDSGKYGPALQQIGFNALLMFSGGPIGLAIKGLGKGARLAALKTFGETSYWDHLSTYYMGGAKDGFSKEIARITNDSALMAKYGYTGASAKENLIRDLSAVANINVRAMGGDILAGVARVAKGMQSQYAIDLSKVSHEAGLADMLKFAQDYRKVYEWGVKNGMPNIAMGRGDVRDLSSIAQTVTEATTTQQQLDNWEIWKNANPLSGFANNDNFDKQIKQIINNGGDVHGEIMKVKARTTVKGFPKDLADELAMNGHIPMAGKNAAPFVEGENKIVTSYVPTNLRGAPAHDFFVKAVQPLPVLKSVGNMMTKMGLSPFAATERTYQLFNDNVTRNLSETNIGKRIQTALDVKATEAAAKRATQGAVDTSGNTFGFSKAEYADLKKQGFTDENIAKMGGKEAPTKAPIEEKAPSQPAKSNLNSSDYLLKRLSNFAHGLKAPIQDMRLLTTHQIKLALKDYALTPGEAKEIQDAIAKAHIQVPWAAKGLGPALVDKTFSITGASAIARRYTRIQMELRFTLNPFYQYLRLIPKTEILSTSEGMGYIGAVFGGRAGEIPKIREGLRAAGMFDETARGLGGGLTGEASGFLGTGSRNLGKKLLPAQEMSIAGLIDDQAQKMGMNWEEYIHNYPQQAADTVQMIAEYNRNSQFLNSPLAKTLNIAFFPFRFDAKVAGIMARGLGRQDMMVQVAVVHGLMRANDWLKTPQGEAWYSQNSEAIGLFKYITPLATMNEVMQSLVPGHDHSLGNFGELGGLPFGWIPMITDSAGLTNFSQSGVDPRTGAAIPQYVPATTRGAAAIAIQDLLGMLFSYPGATVGLPSKTSITRSAALGLVGGTKSKDLRLVTPQLSSQQQQYQKDIQAQNGGIPVMQPIQQPTQQLTQMPRLSAPITTPQVKTKSGSAKKKKSQFIPAALPNQSQIGL